MSITNTIILALFSSSLLTPLATHAQQAVTMDFVAPLFSDDKLGHAEAFFSSPRSFIVFDPVVFGAPEDHENRTTIQVLEPDEDMARQLLEMHAGEEIPAEAYDSPMVQKMLSQLSGIRYAIRISGTVYDELADLVPDSLAAIDSVTLSSDAGPDVVVAVTKLEPVEAPNHPAGFPYQRPFPFAGRFETEPIEAHLLTGVNNHHVTVTNAANRSTGASIRISDPGSETANGEPLEVELEPSSLELGMTNPVFVLINDESVDETNVTEAFATINGHKVGLKIAGGRLQLDRPLIAIAHRPPTGAINVVQVGSPDALDHFTITYKGVTKQLTWSYSR